MSATRPRRIIWITADHLRYDNLAIHGNPAMVTPAMDSLAAGGVDFKNCYTQSALCMPSRCSFMTGLYPQQTGVMTIGQMLSPEFQPTVAHALKAGGYQTAQIGKLHFQPHENLDFDPRPRHTYGFDVFWPSEERGNYSDAYFHWLEGKHPEYAALMRCPRSNDPGRGPIERKPSMIDAPWQVSHAGWIAETAALYLKSRRNSDQFVHMGFYNPHPPLTPTREAWELNANTKVATPQRCPNEWEDKPEPLKSMLSRAKWSDDELVAYRRGINAMVTEMDLALGWFFQQLKDAELWEDSLIILNSDHGDMYGDHGMVKKDAHFYDPVLHTPLVLSWPQGFGPAGRSEDALVEMVDVLPTIMGLSGCRGGERMAGRSYAREILGGKPVAGREEVFTCERDGWAMLRTRTHKYVRFESLGTEVLYDYADEGFEVVNHAGDPTYAGVLNEMRFRMLRRSLQASRSHQVTAFPY